MSVYKNIQLNTSFLPVYGSFIQIPKDTIVWRGYDRLYPALSERPAYFGNREIAESYARTSDTHELGLFATTKPLRLLDIRFLKVLLNDLLYEYTGDAVIRTTIAFGLCSFYHQLRLMMTLYAESIRKGQDAGFKAMESMLNTNSMIEQPGVRVAETSNDGWVMTFLGEVFNGITDGFIAPELFSPYQLHTKNYLHPEIIVFNPVRSGIIQVRSVPQTVDITIQNLIHQQFPNPVKLQARCMKTSYVSLHGGCIHYIPSIEAFNDKLNKGDRATVQLYRQAMKEGKKLRKRVEFSEC
jgi:hypothetical protein